MRVSTRMVTHESRDCLVQLGALRHRIEPARVEFAAQPGELALGQLAGPGGGAVAGSGDEDEAGQDD